MTPLQETNLAHILSSFNVKALGDGDMNAGINTLATMACTLANVTRPGSCILSINGHAQRIGCNLLVSGSLSSGLVTDKIFTELKTRQHNLTEHMNVFMVKKKEEEKQIGPRVDDYTFKPPETQSERVLKNLLHPDYQHVLNTYDDWKTVLASPPTPSAEDLTRHSQFIIDATQSHNLKEELSSLHLDHGLILTSLNRASAKPLNSFCQDIVEGGINANLLVIDKYGSLHDLAKKTESKNIWAGQLPWLIDGCAGPEPYTPTPEEEASVTKLPNISRAFKAALSTELAKRLDIHSDDPSFIKLNNFETFQTRWVTFLQTQEEALPGIAGSAYSFLASLTFGIKKIVTASQKPKGFKWSIRSVELLAQHIILRMANARNVMVFSARDERILRLKKSFVLKLAEGNHTPRELIRRHSGILTAECRDVLAILVKEESVVQTARGFELPEATNLQTINV